jgi:hypothetical protein
VNTLALVKAIREETSDERGELLLNLYLSGRTPRLVIVGDHEPEIDNTHLAAVVQTALNAETE